MTSGMTYERLASRSGIQWPCTEEKPGGTTHLYSDGHFPSGAEYCETYGHDLDTGASMTPEQYRAQDPQGRAVIKASDYLPPFEEPDGQFPFWLTTGRIVYQFHTRTKTGRVAELQASAPDPSVEISRPGCSRLRHRGPRPITKSPGCRRAQNKLLLRRWSWHRSLKTELVLLRGLLPVDFGCGYATIGGDGAHVRAGRKRFCAADLCLRWSSDEFISPIR